MRITEIKLVTSLVVNNGNGKIPTAWLRRGVKCSWLIALIQIRTDY